MIRRLPNRQQALWHACVDCGKERWVRLLRGVPVSDRCISCGKLKNGGKQSTHGYTLVHLLQDDPYYSMTGKKSCRGGGYILEHRLVIARKLGRCLKHEELIHHLNGNRSDNRIENLELTTRQRHSMGYEAGYKQGYEDCLKTIQGENYA